MNKTVFIFLLLSISLEVKAQDMVIITFKSGDVKLDSLQEKIIQDAAEKIQSISKEIEQNKIYVNLIVRSSHDEVVSDNFIGVSRSLIVRDYLIKCLEKLNYSIDLWHFQIIDLGEDEETLNGVQLSVVIR